MEVICGTPKFKKFTREDHQSEWKNAQVGKLISTDEISDAKIFKYKLPDAKSKERMKILLDKAIEHCANSETKPQVVHIVSPMPINVIGRLRHLKRLGVKLIYSHTIARKYPKNILLKKFQKWKTCQVNKQYDAIIVPSNSLKEIISETNPNATIHIIPNGVDTDKFSPVGSKAEKIKLREKLNLPAEAILATHVGAVHPRKGTDLLVEAWSKLVAKHDNLHLVLIGPRYDQTREELKEFRYQIEQAIKLTGKQANIHFVGQIENVKDYLQASDMFVFPSKREGMPNAVLEAMATGLPVIVTPFIGLSDDFGRLGKEFLLTEREKSAIADTIKSILDDQDVSASLGKSARDWVVQTMNLEKSVRIHAALYKSLAQNQSIN